MKKISRKDLQGLRRQFPVLSKEAMKNYVGGYNGGYTGGGIGDDWLDHGFYFKDPDGNYHWYSGYTQEELDNWEGDWPGGWVAGWGYVAPDGFGYGTYQGWNNYDPWGYDYPWNNDYLGWSENGYPGYFGFYGYYGYDENFNTGNTGNWGGGGAGGTSDSSSDSLSDGVNINDTQYYDGTDGRYRGQGSKDCSLQSIAAITGLPLEVIHQYASEVIQRELNVSADYANIMAGLPLKESEIEAVLEMAGGDCFNVYINGNYDVTFSNSIGLINHHVVKVVSYDASTRLIHWIDPQNNNEKGSAPLSSFYSIKSFSNNV